jgi:putative addiction module component (TIGR02574 family)
MDSIFDLSPAEKLQLVEDLWDDLAAVPETVLVHQWQKDELARRKENLQKHQLSPASWKDLRKSVRDLWIMPRASSQGRLESGDLQSPA